MGSAKRLYSPCQWLPSNSLTFRSYAISHHGWFISVSSHTIIAGPSVPSGKQECHLRPASLASLTPYHIRKLLTRFPLEHVVSFPSVLERAILWWPLFIHLYLKVFINLKNIKVRGKKLMAYDFLLLLFSFLNIYWGKKERASGFLFFLYHVLLYFRLYSKRDVFLTLIIQWTEVTKILHI